MMKLEALPKGFRFRPTDEELVNHYLRLKINGHHSAVEVIPEVDVCKWEPWDLPAMSVIKSEDPEWFFFCPRDRKYPNGHRSNRATEAGYWKATGKDRTIKSRRSSSPSRRSNIHLIGTKKTLVFYRGRAPKGERTNWIMHEYRATEPDLDGLAPGQGDYVLCRLFHKAEIENSKFDEAEPTGSSPSANKSSPDDESSDLFHDSAVLETFKERDDLVPVQRCESNGAEHSREISANKEVLSPIKEIPTSEEATCNHFDDKVLEALPCHDFTDSGACVGSPFADDFGNGFHFQDGTSEQDVSLSELLEGLQHHDNYFCEEPTHHIKTERPTTNICEDRETDTEMVQAQGQISPNSFRFALSNMNPVPPYYGVGRDDSYAIKDSSAPSSGTGIKIRSRQPQNRSSLVNSTTQGTTSRRIRLLMECRPNSVSCENSDQANITEQESQPLIVTRVNKDTEDQVGKNVDENKDVAQTREELLADKNGGTEKKLLVMSGHSKVYSVSICIVIILSVVLLGVWKCPNMHPPYA